MVWLEAEKQLIIFHKLLKNLFAIDFRRNYLAISVYLVLSRIMKVKNTAKTEPKLVWTRRISTEILTFIASHPKCVITSQNSDGAPACVI